ncbi:hypothetical protein [Arthrobacter methylotrophus]
MSRATLSISLRAVLLLLIVLLQLLTHFCTPFRNSETDWPARAHRAFCAV